MKFLAEAQTLSAALKKVGQVIESRNTIPILSNIVIAADEKTGAVTLKGTDLDVEVTLTLAAQVETGGAITAPAHMLESYVTKAPKGAQIEIGMDGNFLTCHMGRSRVKMQTLAAEDFPDFNHGDMPYQFEMTAAEFCSLLDRAKFAISTEETRYYLNGIYLHPSANAAGHASISACATDGHRLALVHHPLPDTDISQFPGIIIPRKTVLLLIKLCDGAKTAKVAYSQSKIRVDLGSVVLVSKLIDGTFPDYQRVIPRNNNKIASVNRAALAAAVDRVTTVSVEKGRAAKLEFADGRLVVSCNSADHGSATEDIDIGYDADPVTLGLNSRYIADMLQAFTAETLDFAIDDAGSPVTVNVNGDPNRVCVAMPMRA